MALTEKQKAIFSRPAQTETQPTLTVSQALARKQVQVGMQKTAPKVPKSFSERFKGAGKALESKFLKPATETFISPLAREVERPFVSAIRGIQGLVPGGKTGKEPVSTPFGEVKPITELKPSEAALGAAEVGLTVIPAEKVVGKLVKPVSRFFGGFAKRLGGTLSGKGVDILEKIIENPEAAKIGLRGDDVAVLKDVATSARKGVKDLAKQAGKQYEQAIDALPKKVDIDSQKIFNKINTAFEDFGIKVKKGILDFSESPLDEAQERTVNKMYKMITKPRRFDDPKGLNTLAQKISKFRKPADKELSKIVDSSRRAIRDVVGEEVPELKNALGSFSQASDFLDAIKGELSIKGAFGSREGVIKTSKKIQNIFNSNKELSRALVEEFETKAGTDILAKEAGRQLGSAPSRAQVSIGDVARNIIQTVIPPKAVGEIAAATGIAKQKVQPFVELLNTFAPAERVSVFNLFRSAFSDEEKTQ